MNSEEAASTRIDWVDYAKGWCIVLVVMMHSTLGVGDALGGEGFLHSVVAWARPFRMPDFFLISGLFLSRSIALDWRRYADRKILHFLYFFLVWTLIQLLAKKGSLLLSAPQSFFAELGFAFVEPFGTLWFIYLLPLMFLVARLTRTVPPSLMLAAAMALELAGRVTGWQSGYVVIDEFMGRFVYFYAGYALAPAVFRFAAWVRDHRLPAALGLVLWGIVEALVAFTPASSIQSGLEGVVATLPVMSLIAGFAGALAVVALSQLLASLRWLPMLRYCGARSLVIYLSFFLPMALTRTILVDLGMSDIGLKSAIVTLVAIVVPLLLHRLVRGTALAFLYERPDWLKLAGREQAASRPSAPPAAHLASPSPG